MSTEASTPEVAYVLFPDDVTDCERLGHDWSRTGLYHQGRPLFFCRRPACDVGLAYFPAGYAGTTEPERWRPVRGCGLAVNGLPLDLEDDPEGGVAKLLCFETGHHYDLASVPFERGDVVIDVGAHIGVVSIYLALRYADLGLRILAYEPCPATFARLERNIAANGARGIDAHNLAVTDAGLDVTITGSLASNSGGVALKSLGLGQPGEQTWEVGSTTLAAIFAEHSLDRCKLLKIDCEGAEYGILTAPDAPLDRIDYLRGEFHDYPAARHLGLTPTWLLDRTADHLGASRVRVTVCRIGA